MAILTRVFNDLSEVPIGGTDAVAVALWLLLAGAAIKATILIRGSKVAHPTNSEESVMPDRSYVPRATPTLIDRVLHHPFEIVLAAWWVICGALLALSLLWPELPNSPAVTSLPMWLALLLTALVGGGGLSILVGLLRSWEKNIATGWLFEQIGLSAIGAGWLAYSTAVYSTYPHSLVSWSLGICFSAAAVLRFVATLVIESRTRRAIAEGG